MSRRIVLSIVTVLGCAGPAASGTPSTSPTAQLQSAEAASYRPTDEQIAYGIMAASAMKQARFLTLGSTVGVYQSDDPRHPLHPIVELVLEGNVPFRAIRKGEMQVACTMPTSAGLRGTGARSRVCGLDRADVLYQLISVQVMRDSGYVGGYLTQVTKGEDRPRTTVFCFISVWRPQQRAWEDVRNSLVREPLDCSAGRKH